jgi:Rrf2 family protein
MRLELSRRTDLALRALHHLERTGSRVKRSDLAAAVGTTPDFLARVMGPVVKAGWAASEPGRSGGYEIATHPEEISVLELIEVMEGTPLDGECVLGRGRCEVEGRCALHDAWTRARGALLEELDQTPVGRGGK